MQSHADHSAAMAPTRLLPARQQLLGYPLAQLVNIGSNGPEMAQGLPSTGTND